jgi:3-methyladenine DNA glycosylase AlkC
LNGEKKSYVREEVKDLLNNLEKKNKYLFPSVKNALQNPELEHLFVRPKKTF